MKLNYPYGYVALKIYVKDLGCYDLWKLRKDGHHRQLRTKSGEILNYWESTGTIDFQGRLDGPLRTHFTAFFSAAGKGHPPAVSPARTIASDVSPQDYLPLDPRAHIRRALFPDPDQELILVNLNERQGRIDDIFASLPHEAAAGELMFAAVRKAQKTMPEEDVYAALCAVACAVMTTGMGFGLYARIDAILRGMPEEEL